MFQHYLHSPLANLLNMHIVLDSKNVIGSIVMQLGYAEMYCLGSCGQDQSDLSDLPVQDGCTLYQLLIEPNGVNMENLTVDVSGVSFEIMSTLKVSSLPQVYWDVVLCCL